MVALGGLANGCGGGAENPRPSAGTGGEVAGSGGAGVGSGAGAGAPAAGGGGTTASGSGGSSGRAAAGSGGQNGSAAGGGAAGVPAAGSGGSWWKPVPGTSWQWQLTGKLDTSLEVDVYDIDLFTTPAATIQLLHGQGRKVICYMDTAYEPDRPDSAALEPYRGNPIDGWPGQYWLDVREPKVLEVMKARIAMAESKGCDAIEADDVDARSNDPGFPIRPAEQQAFIRALAVETHAKGMAFGLKNDLEEIDALIDVSDFAINEECFAYDECDALLPFIRANKAVFHVEYSDDDLAGKADEICQEANRRNFDSLVKRWDLDAARRACR